MPSEGGGTGPVPPTILQMLLRRVGGESLLIDNQNASGGGGTPENAQSAQLQGVDDDRIAAIRASACSLSSPDARRATIS